MTSLDDELAKAAEPVAEPAVEPARAGTPPGAERRAGLRLLAGLVVAGGAILALVFGFESSAVYAKGVDELVAERDRVGRRAVRVDGVLVRGSLVRRDDPCEYRFTLEKNGERLDVRYSQCVVPDTFRDVPGIDVQVTAEGRLDSGGWFQATQIMAKCPSKYEAKEHAGADRESPHVVPTLPAATQGR
ncbi:MAG: cytochrome c maturation protein CcmE [Polyangiaceae bacterium]|nr:cytochrome c maturation protein CcmE [Polyangiaceae bacterium]